MSFRQNEDFKLHPDKYCDLVPEGDGELSPRGKHGDRRKPSSKLTETVLLQHMYMYTVADVARGGGGGGGGDIHVCFGLFSVSIE